MIVALPWLIVNVAPGSRTKVTVPSDDGAAVDAELPIEVVHAGQQVVSRIPELNLLCAVTSWL